MFSLTTCERIKNSKNRNHHCLSSDLYFFEKIIKWTKNYFNCFDCNAAGGKVNCYEFSGGQFGDMYMEPIILFVEQEQTDV